MIESVAAIFLMMSAVTLTLSSDETGQAFALPSLGYTHTTSPIEERSVSVYNEFRVEVTHGGYTGSYLAGLRIRWHDYSMKVTTWQNYVKYEVYYGDSMIDSGSVYVGQEISKSYKDLKYYLRVTGTGWNRLAEYVVVFNVTHPGKLVVYSTNFEIHGLPPGPTLGVRMGDKISSKPKYVVNGLEKDDPNGNYQYRESPEQLGKITISFNHLPDWRKEGNAAYFETYKNYGISQILARAKQPDGVIFSKVYEPTTKQPDIAIQNLALLLIVVAAIVLVSAAGIKYGG